MLVSFQRFDIGALGARRRFWGVFGRGLYVHVVHQTLLGADESMVPTLGYGRPETDRQLIGYTLDGRSAVRLGEGSLREVNGGDVLVMPGRSAFRSRLEVSEEASFSVNIEFDRRMHRAVTLAPAFARLHDVDRTRSLTEALTDAIEQAWHLGAAMPLVVSALDELFALLRSDGFPLPPMDLNAPHSVPTGLQAIGRAVDLAFSQTDARPMLVDIESEASLSSRTFQRALPLLCDVWGQKPETFRAYRKRVQIGRAVGSMVHPRATTEGVSKTLGFSTPNAFCRAMAKYGLPSPGNVRERFKAIV